MTPPIVVGLALREDAAPLALAGPLADAARAPLLLVTVVAPEGPARVPAPEYYRALRHDAEQRLAAVAATLGDHDVTTLVREGSRAAVLHGSTCPVVIAPRGYEQDGGELGRIGVAFDGSAESEEALTAAAGRPPPRPSSRGARSTR